jgi:hypothetical protein
VKKNRGMTEKIRQAVFERDHYACGYCGLTTPPFHAFSKGGLTVMDNLITACRSCNGKKGNKIGWLPNPTNIDDQIKTVVSSRFPLVGFLFACIGFLIIIIGHYWSMAFEVNFNNYLWAGLITGFCGIVTGLMGY